MLAAVALIPEVTVGTTGIQSVVMLPVGVPMVSPAFYDEGGFVQVLLKETVTFTLYKFVPGEFWCLSR